MLLETLTTLPEWANITVQSIAGSIAVITAAWKGIPLIKKILKNKREKADKAKVIENARVLRGSRILLKEWKARKGAQRVLLLHAKDSGKPWKPTDKIKVSCLDQVVDGDETNTWSRWQDWECDPPYRDFLADVIVSDERQRGVLLIADTMPASVLKDAYRAEGTVASVIIPFKWIGSENALVYCSVNFGCKKLSTINEEQDPEVKKEMIDMKFQYESQARKLFANSDRIRTLIQEGKHIWKTVV